MSDGRKKIIETKSSGSHWALSSLQRQFIEKQHKKS